MRTSGAGERNDDAASEQAARDVANAQDCAGVAISKPDGATVQPSDERPKEAAG
jgi:hypothetical protein